MSTTRGFLSTVLFLVAFACPLASQTDTPQDDLAKPFNWPEIVSKDAGIQFSLRTRWADGVLKYVATFVDGKGRIARHLLRHPDNGAVPLSSFQVTFSDEDGFRLYMFYIVDRSLSEIEGTVKYEAYGESSCTEKIYRAALKAAAKAAGTAESAHGFNFPSELTEVTLPARKN